MTNCTTDNLNNNKIEVNLKNNFSNKGFALIYNDSLYNKKIVSNKIDERSLIIFQKNLKKNANIKITNILNNKSLIVKVGKNSNYPSFYNSVISPRIAEQLDLNIDEPYVEISVISKNSLFIAKKAKTFDEEKKVANKVPVNSISINDLNSDTNIKKKITNKDFLYLIKIADFYFDKTATIMLDRIKNETKVNDPKIQKISSNKYRVYLGPFSNISSLQKSFNDIKILDFENIEIIRYD